jgi:hypothetical protein
MTWMTRRQLAPLPSSLLSLLPPITILSRHVHDIIDAIEFCSDGWRSLVLSSLDLLLGMKTQWLKILASTSHATEWNVPPMAKHLTDDIYIDPCY